MVRNSKLKRVLCGVVLLAVGMLATGCDFGEAAVELVRMAHRNATRSDSDWGWDWDLDWDWDDYF